jgi:peptide-methionine (S)-S-oxide reductase
VTRIGFGGGCHWCTEAVFQSLRGVDRVEQGFIRSAPPHDAWSEAVIVHFEPARIDLATLVEAHLHTHAATRRHRLRDKYRSAVYTFNDAQTSLVKTILQDLQAMFHEPLVTGVLPFAGFRQSEPRFHDYYRRNPSRPFCQRHIEPKLTLIRQRFSHRIRE